MKRRASTSRRAVIESHLRFVNASLVCNKTGMSENYQGVVQIAQANADDAIRTEAAQTIPHVDKPTEKKARPTLEDLPAGCSQKQWKTVFVPTWLEFIGGLPNPYDLQDINIVNVLQAFFDNVFVDIQYSISVHDAVYKLVSICCHLQKNTFY